MSLRCGLYAVNALLRHLKTASPVDAAELDDLTVDLHSRERAVCPDGTDLVPDREGNYPVETLMLALAQRGLHCAFVRTVPPAPPRGTVGYLLATGSHYLSVVRQPGRDWQLVNNGDVTDTDAHHPGLIVRRNHIRARAVLQVTVKPR
jgi:hypothetical protein